MSLKSQKNNMSAIHKLVSQDLSYIFRERESGPNGAKKEFLTKSAAFMRALGKDLGFTEMTVRTNPAGIACSGGVSLYGMWSPGNGVFFEITQSCMTPPAFLYRSISKLNDYHGGDNQWLSCGMFARQAYDELVSSLLNLNRRKGDALNAA